MKIGFIGLGLMGAPMASNVAKKHNDTVYLANRTAEKAQKLAEELQEAGYDVYACDSNRQVAENADIVISMVTGSADVQEIYEEILPLIRPGMLCIDMSTIDPAVSLSIAERVKEKGAMFTDAPVVKSTAAAAAGKLGIYVGADEKTYETALPILQYMGENIIHMGENGRGLVMKLCHNALVSQIQNGVNETLSIAQKNGIGVADYIRAISYGGGQNFYLDGHAKMLETEDFTAMFSLQNANKDVHLFMDLAKQTGMAVPGEENAVRVYEEAMEKGLGAEDWGATIKIVRG